MKVKIDSVLKDIKGEPLKAAQDSDKILTLKDVLSISLCFIEQKGSTPEESVKRYNLLRSVTDAETEVDISAEDISLMKQLIAKTYGSPVVSGQACLLLEGVVK